MRHLVVIDGSNFYFKLKTLDLERKIFAYNTFCEWITGAKKHRCVYYVGAVKQEEHNERSKKLYAKQRAFLADLSKQGVNVELGYILKSGGTYHEKGVDVKMAVDVLVGAYEKLYDKVYLVSSDTDLIPAVSKAIEKRKLVEYVGFAHQPSYALIKACSSVRLLHKKDLSRFIS